MMYAKLYYDIHFTLFYIPFCILNRKRPKKLVTSVGYI